MITSAAVLHVIDHTAPVTLDRRLMLYLPEGWCPRGASRLPAADHTPPAAAQGGVREKRPDYG
jgi:hypothetical protein